MADPSSVRVTISGQDVTRFARVGRVRIDDVLNDAPNTAALSVVLENRIGTPETGPFAPLAFDHAGFNTLDNPGPILRPPPVAVGAPIGIYLNGGADQIFGGEVLTRDQYAEFDQPAHVRLDLTCTDFTRRLNYRKVSKDYATASATAIVLDVMATCAPTFGVGAVQAGLPSLSGGITFTFEDVGRALSRIAEKIGAYWYVDYAATLHFFTGTESGATPAPLVPGGRFADLKVTADLSQVRTRILVEGDGATVAATLPAGDAIVPVSQTTPFDPAGGLATFGAARVTYAGLIAAGPTANTTGTASGGSSGGPPPAAPGPPSASVASAATPGALVGGPYQYAATFELADGTRSGLGTPSGPITIAAVGSPPPTSAALGGTPTKGPIAIGIASIYATSFLSADGKETDAAQGGSILTGRAIANQNAGFSANPANGGSLAAGYYYYMVTFLTPDGGETTGLQVATNFVAAGSYVNIVLPTSSDGRVSGRRVYRSSVAATNVVALPWRFIQDIPDRNSTFNAVDDLPDASRAPKTPPTFSTATNIGEAATVNVPTSGDPRVVGRRLYRKDGPGEYRFLAELRDNTTGTFNDVIAAAPGGALAPTVNNIRTGAVNVSGIPTGPAGTVTRRVFRTVAGGTQYRELVALADNTTTDYLDNQPDANLGGAPLPAVGTAATAGSIPPTPAGATQIRVTNLTGFPSAGWVLVESALIRYTGTSTAGGNLLTGIPASGPGSITADIANGTAVALSPALVNVAPLLAVTLGDATQLLAQVDDVPAQTALAAIEGGDGIIEHYIQDRRLSQAGAQARGLAELALFKTVETRVSYTTHDVETKSGRTVHVALPAPTNLTGDFLIQQVTIDDVAIAANWMPKRAVQASTTRFSFDDVLARILLEQR